MLTITLALSFVVAAPVERRLHPSSIEASSFLWNNWNKFQENYHPNYVADDDPKSAWVEGADGSGEHEWIRFNTSVQEKTTEVRLRVRNGFQAKKKSLFKANARIKRVSVQLMPASVSKIVTLKDAWDWQEVRIPLDGKKFSRVQLTVLSVYPGTRYKDLCLSDVQLFATSTTAENPRIEKERIEKILAWKKERRAMAAAFATSEAPPRVAPSYQPGRLQRLTNITERHVLPFDIMVPKTVALPSEVQEALARKDWKPIAANFDKRRATPKVDGIRTPYPVDTDYDDYYGDDAIQMCVEDCEDDCAYDNERSKKKAKACAAKCPPICNRNEIKGDLSALFLPYPVESASLRTEDISFAEATKVRKLQKKFYDRREDWGGTMCTRKANYAAQYWRDADGRQQLRALKATGCRTYENRGGSEANVFDQYLYYDNAGNLALLVSEQIVVIYQWQQRGDGSWFVAAGTIFASGYQRQIGLGAES